MKEIISQKPKKKRMNYMFDCSILVILRKFHSDRSNNKKLFPKVRWSS